MIFVDERIAALFNDLRLSFDSIGLLGYMLMNPEIPVTKSEIVARGLVGSTKAQRILAEWRCCGYLRRVRKHRANGDIYYETTLYDDPRHNPDVQALCEFLLVFRELKVTTRSVNPKPVNAKVMMVMPSYQVAAVGD